METLRPVPQPAKYPMPNFKLRGDMETLETLRYHLEVHEASYSMAKKARDATRQRIAELECPYKVGQDIRDVRGCRYQVVRVQWAKFSLPNRTWVIFATAYREDGQLSQRGAVEIWRDITTEPPKEA